ncbi:hypothetical protein CW745_02735 [Psychromonas sp. psych-6C06]|uniref:transposase n=1 Tax=Psychromonas sp. psych-6C06 TaxID=2058089 RepID=UPI000C330E50|nr:transposase [Psychromonas sp. psych-6C06]PKF63771.1 hypothetical protein CW745_02735 [Psychromonas sp. psych-6C06]
MPRPLRLEYENACYHVMNRGRGRQRIFYDDSCYLAFIESLKEAHERFGLVIHAYCLMPNHYHLLVQTPRANLSRCMRHINGVYTQRFNRLRKTDGPLFRGRYKALIVDVDNYFLQVSRYIHRNPIDCAIPLVDQLDTFKWSSFPAYVDKDIFVEWLQRDFTLAQFDDNQQRYNHFVHNDTDHEVKDILDKTRWPAILGSQCFVEQIKAEQKNSVTVNRINKLQNSLPEIETVIAQTAKLFLVGTKSIAFARRGRGTENLPRWCAIYLAREIGDHPLNAIASAFNMGHVSGINQVIKKLKARLDSDNDLKEKLKLLTQVLTP